MNKARTALYLLPGTQCDDRLWQQVIDLLPPQYHCHCLPIPQGKDIDEIVVKISQQLPKEPVNLIGFSLGGYLSSALTCAYPQQINKLMVLANTPTELPTFEIRQREFALTMLKASKYSGITSSRIKQLLAPIHHTNTSVINLIKQMDETGGPQQFSAQVSSTTSRKDLLAPLAALTLPMQFVHGEFDALIDKSWLQALQQRGVSCSEIKQCGHMSPLESPQEVAERIIKFFVIPNGLNL